MADSGGHWLTLDEAKKLSQYFQVPGVVDDNVKLGNPFTLFPLANLTGTGTAFKWLRKTDSAVSDVVNITPTSKNTRVWTDSSTYTLKDAELRGCNISRLLNKFVSSIYGTFNNYEKITADEMDTAMIEALGQKLIYDDETYGSDTVLEMDGLHARAAENYGEDWDIDASETALSIAKWRQLGEAMKLGVDFYLVPTWVPRRLGAMLQEAGTASWVGMGHFTWAPNDLGKRVYMFDSTPIIPCDFLGKEVINTGISTNKRTSSTAGTVYSMFGVKLGKPDITSPDPGAKILFGNVDNQGTFSNLEYFDKLETMVNTKGMSKTAYTQFICGSKYAVGRIWDFTNAAFTA
jgi:hypothetical protein